MYGPSYVSFEWALQHYGLIPERVFEVKSCTTFEIFYGAETLAAPVFIYDTLFHFAGFVCRQNARFNLSKLEVESERA